MVRSEGVKQRVGKGTKWDAVVCSSGSDGEDGRTAETEEEAEERVAGDATVKEEPVSEEEEPLFKRSSKLKAQLILSRYNQTGGDANVYGDDYIPDIIRREEDAAVNSFHIHAELPPLPDNHTSSSTNDNNDNNNSVISPLSSMPEIDTSNHNADTPPLPQPSPSPKKTRRSRSRRTSASSTNSASATSNAISSTTTTAGEVDITASNSTLVVENGEVSNGTEPDGGGMFRYAVSNVDNAVPIECNVPITSIVQEDIRRMVTRVLHLLKQLIEHLRLPHSSIQEYMRPLLMKSVVVAIRESYTGNKFEASFLEQQIQDFTEIVQRELPFDQLGLLLETFVQPKISMGSDIGNVAAGMERVSDERNHVSSSQAQINASSFSSQTTESNNSVKISSTTNSDNHNENNDNSNNSNSNSNNSNNNFSDNSNEKSNEMENCINFTDSITTDTKDFYDQAITVDNNVDTSINTGMNIIRKDGNAISDHINNDINNDNIIISHAISVGNDLSVSETSNSSCDVDVKKSRNNKARKSVVNKPVVNPLKGPHRFYRTPKKAKKKTLIGEVTLESPEDDNVRYKDRVNKIFAAKLAANKLTTTTNTNNSAKVVDLTDLTVDSEKEDNENENENKSSDVSEYSPQDNGNIHENPNTF